MGDVQSATGLRVWSRKSRLSRTDLWVRSSDEFMVRAVGGSGMEYVRGSVKLHLDAEALATRGFVLNLRGIPEEVRDQVVADVSRAWRWAGFDVETVGP